VSGSPWSTAASPKSTASCIKAADLARSGAHGIVAGHCGLPFTQIIDGRLWHNPGAVGQPANDGTSRAWFSVIACGPEPGLLNIAHVALDYDHETAAAKMCAAGLPAGYADALSTGLWPSCDVLPPTELKARGDPLNETAIRWTAQTSSRGASGLESGARPPTSSATDVCMKRSGRDAGQKPSD
jgi:hypothetical protein